MNMFFVGLLIGLIIMIPLIAVIAMIGVSYRQKRDAKNCEA